MPLALSLSQCHWLGVLLELGYYFAHDSSTKTHIKYQQISLGSFKKGFSFSTPWCVLNRYSRLELVTIMVVVTWSQGKSERARGKWRKKTNIAAATSSWRWSFKAYMATTKPLLDCYSSHYVIHLPHWHVCLARVPWIVCDSNNNINSSSPCISWVLYAVDSFHSPHFVWTERVNVHICARYHLNCFFIKRIVVLTNPLFCRYTRKRVFMRFIFNGYCCGWSASRFSMSPWLLCISNKHLNRLLVRWWRWFLIVQRCSCQWWLRLERWVW